MGSASRRWSESTRPTSRASSSPMRCRSAAAPAMSTTDRRPTRGGRLPRGRNSPGVCSTRSTSARATAGRIVWRMDPKQERQAANRGATLWGNLIISPASHPARIIATDKETGKVVWETNVPRSDQNGVTYTGAPLADQGQDHRRRGERRPGRARLDRRARCQDRQAALAQIHDPRARRARQRNLEGQHQCLADRRRRGLGDRHLRSATEPDGLGHRQSGPDVRPLPPPGRQPLHQQRHLLRARDRAR